MLKFLPALCSLLFAVAAASSLLFAETKRIVSLLPSNTEILFALGVGKQVVGVTTFCDYPVEARQKEKVGGFFHPQIEKIISLKPDLVFAGKWQTSRVVLRLRQVGLNVIEIRVPANLEEIYETILKIAGEVGKKSEGESLILQLKQRVRKIERPPQKSKKLPSVYIEIDLPNWTVTKKSFVSDAIERCGLQNIFRDLPLSAVQISWETVVEKNPDVIILFAAKKEEIIKRAGWRRIAAIKNERVIDGIGKDILNRPTPRIVQGMEELSRKLSEFGFK